MLKFECGEFIGGTNDGILNSNYNRATPSDWEGISIASDCWVFTIPVYGSEIKLLNAEEYGINTIPLDYENLETHHELFWCSELTIMFGNYDKAIEFLKNYKGPHEDIILGFYLLHTREDTMEEVMEDYKYIAELDGQSNKNLYEELSNFAYTRDYNPDTVIATMKLFVIDYYRYEHADKIMSHQNV